MFLGKALRYRRFQTAVLLGVSLLIGACASFGPLFARAVEQSITTSQLTEQRDVAAWRLRVGPERTTEPDTLTTMPPEALDALRPEAVRALFSAPVYGMNVLASWKRPGWADGGVLSVRAPLTWRDGFCAHLTIRKGRCPAKAGEVAVSTADVANYTVAVGNPLRASTTDNPALQGLRVTGIYEADRSDPFWYAVTPVGRSKASDSGGAGDLLFTPRETFEQASWGYTSTVDSAPMPGRVRVDDLDFLRRQTDELNTLVAGDPREMALDTGLGQVLDEIAAGRHQAVTIIPLVMVQVAIFGVVVLALAGATVVDQRRAELAVARLRGRGARRAGRELFNELGLLVTTGVLAGLVAGFAATTVVRNTWLAGTTPAELVWTGPAAGALALAAGLGAVLLAVRPVARLPVATLLRTVPARRRARPVGTFGAIVIAVAVAGLVASVTGDGRGPLAIVTPSLLALAAGLVSAGLLTAVAGPLGTAALRGGRLGFGLAALQLARRRGLTQLVPVLAVATALVAFAGQASSVAGRNRDERAGYEVGADAVLQLGAATEVQALPAVLERIDPKRQWLTPVVEVRSPSPQGLTTMAVEPDSFRRIGHGATGITDPETFEQIRSPSGAAGKTVDVRGSRLSLTVAPMRTPRPNAASPGVLLSGELVTPSGSRVDLSFGLVPYSSTGKTGDVTLSAPLDCAKVCHLLRLKIAQAPGEPATVKGRMDILGARTDVGAVDLGGPTRWTADRLALAEENISPTQPSGGRGGLGIEFSTAGSTLELQNRSVPLPAPVLISADYRPSENEAIPGLDGTAVPVTAAGPVTGPVPQLLGQAAVVDLTTMLRRGGLLELGSTSLQLWLGPDGVRHLAEIQDGLRKAGISSVVLDRLDERKADYARSASALALRLTPVVGIAAGSLALIVLLLLAVTTWRSRAHDHAGLRISGVDPGITARAARTEQLLPVLIAATLGIGCGVIGAQLALPLIPLFAKEQPLIPLDLGVDWPVAVLTWLAGAVVLTVAAVALGIGLARRATYARITEEVQ